MPVTGCVALDKLCNGWLLGTGLRVVKRVIAWCSIDREGLCVLMLIVNMTDHLGTNLCLCLGGSLQIGLADLGRLTLTEWYPSVTLNKRTDVSCTSVLVSLIPDCGYSVTSCLPLLLPTNHDRPYPSNREPKKKKKPFLL